MLIALLQAKNEAKNIPAWLENVAAAVDGIIAIDDGSTDGTAELLAAHPKMLKLIRKAEQETWEESHNQITLVKTAREFDATWLMPVDADERMEPALAVDLPMILSKADEEGFEAFSFNFRECWGDRHHYRSDGMWGNKARHKLFRSNPAHRMFDPRKLHRHWMPMELVMRFAKIGRALPYNFYHLNMIKPEDRRARFELYKRLDPDNRWQTQGYDYLIDETGLELTKIPTDRAYLPADDAATE